jgi:RimJ/RimL family protein N-acetyltransferase
MKLVNCDKDYWEFVRTLRTHPDNKIWFYTQSKITSDQQKKFMETNSDNYKICILEDTPVGYIGLIDGHEITYCVDPDYKGKGIGTFMVNEILKEGIDAYVKIDNISSQKVFEKLGFEKQYYYTYKNKKII